MRRPIRRQTSRASTPQPRLRFLVSLAFHTRVTGADVYREGITGITPADIASAQDIGCVVKLLAICQLSPQVVGAAQPNGCRCASTRQ